MREQLAALRRRMEYAPGSEHIVIDNLTKSMVLMA